MASYDSLKVRSLLKKGRTGYRIDDTSKALRIRSKGGHTVTHVIDGSTTLELHDSDGTQTIDCYRYSWRAL
jgi:hypothetical protein